MEEGMVNQFQRDDSLIKRKLLEYLPALIVTNMSTFLLLSVDSLVVGNLVSDDALAAVNIFVPATTFIGAITTILSCGASSALSTCMGQNNLERLASLKRAVRKLLVIICIVNSIFQIPIVYILITLYHLSPDINLLTWEYAIGIMISTPFAVVSTFGTYMLQIIGKNKPLIWMTAAEGISNLILDLIFVGPFGMGVFGASMGTACANILRSILTLLYLIYKTDVFKTGDAKYELSDIKEVLLAGLPESTNMAVIAMQNYIFMILLVRAFGDSGGVIKGAVAFCLSIVTIFTSGIVGAVRPLSGLLSGADDRRGVRSVIRHGIVIMVIAISAVTIIFEIFPEYIYIMHGVDDIPEGGILALRLGVLDFVFKGTNSLFRLYFSNRKDSRFSTRLTLIGNCTLPLIAWIILMTMQAPFIMLTTSIVDTIILIVNILRYRQWLARDMMEDNPEDRRLYLTVKPENAIDASHYIREFAKENGANEKHAFRAALCMEEMVAYAEKSHDDEDVAVQVMVRFLKDSALLMILDDGACIFLDQEPEKKHIITTNYGLLRKLSKTVDYQYILNLNFTVCTY